ncbi:hypothetical protein [Leptolyngbya ohadii]|uniref:hypothetical protein n=1 Tax=Leptolyngbya ohadii TaxID=1962290 RepID=UPI00117B5C54|nr:hypothetical protein [Leptolyngbya ohadii]
MSVSITCVALYLTRIAKEEMVRIFATIVTLLSFAAGLVFAPWFIQLLVLMFITVFWRSPVFR